MNFVALVPARGGSKGLPGKNLMEVQGISLVARAILLAKQIPDISRVILSTDDERIIEEGRRAGGEVPFRRPLDLSRSDTPMLKVLEHAVEWIRNDVGNTDDGLSGLVVLQPTSPMRKKVHIIEALDLYRRKKHNGENIAGVISVSPVPSAFYPFRIFKYTKKRNLSTRNERCQPITNLTNDKSIENLFYRNGAVIVLDPNHLSALNSFSPKILPYIIEEPLISIDTLYDLLCVGHCGRRLEPY